MNTQLFHLMMHKFRLYWSLTKSLQTFLLLSTGLAGFMSSRCPWLNLPITLAVAGSLYLAISGSTVLNMWYDRDIDARMARSCWRPLPSGQVSPREALILGLILSILGVGWSLSIDLLYGAVIFTGLFVDVVVYTIWLKRRTAWSILWGGVSGGMPILAGRVLGIGEIEWVGLMLALAVLLWQPTHVLTFSIRYRDDYANAGVPTFPSTYGVRATRIIVAVTSITAAFAMGAAAIGIGMTIGYLRLMLVLSAGLLALAISTLMRPTERTNFGLFKYASLYMASSMMLLVAEAF
jgi:heme o synthase